MRPQLPTLFGALLVGIASGATVVFLIRHLHTLLTLSPEGWAVGLAAIALLANGIVGYHDRIFARHRCLFCPRGFHSTPKSIEFDTLVMNTGNRSVAISSVYLNAVIPQPGVGTGMASAAWPEKTPEDPVILAVGEIQRHVFRFRYHAKLMFESPEVGTLLEPDRKQVQWYLSVAFADSSGVGQGFDFQPIATSEIRATGDIASSGLKILYPVEVLNQLNFWGVFR